MNELNSYDRIAPVYDRLATIVFGDAIRMAQRTHLDELRFVNSILVVGGGTGWLLRDLLDRNHDGRITYLEASKKMITMAEKGLSAADRQRVTFVHGTERSLSGEGQFDAVIINFFADLFPSEDLSRVIKQLRAALRPGALLLCTDFVDDNWWQRTLLKVMYAFFRLTTGMKNQRLSPWRAIIQHEGFKLVRSTNYWRRFIWSELYSKET